MGTSFLQILKKRDFSRIWTAQILSQIVSNMLNFALILHIYDLTGSLTTISLVLIASTVPSVIFGPFSGVITDRVRYKKVLIYTNILRFLVAILLIPAAHNTLAILEIIFLMSAISQFFAPAEMSSIPLIVDRSEIVAANSIYIATLYGSLIIGYGIAGPILGLIGSSWLFVLVAMAYLISAISISSMSNFDMKETGQRLSLYNLASSISSVWEQTKEGLSYIKNKENVRGPMIKLAIGWAMLGSFIVVMPGFAQHTVGISTKMAGVVLIAPAGIGMLVSSYLLNKYKNWIKGKVITSGFVICGITLLALASYGLYGWLHFAIIIAVLLMIILGMSAAFVYISTQSLLHLNSEVKMRGRVFGISAMMINLALGLPALFIGGIADLTSPVFTLIILALIIIIYSAVLLFDE
ncbi:MAG: MFS transporter [Candidatus Berkelbacteria bacterium]